MKVKCHLICILMLLLCSYSFSQSKIVNVNYATGAANVVIPVYTIARGQVALPISLVYSGTGVRPKDVESSAGIGWTLQAGGQISRQLRDLPDDCVEDISLNTRYGWMNSSNANQSAVNGFSIANNGSTCSYESSDLSYLSSFSSTSDTEPDIFNVSAPGLSCQLVYDNTISNFRPLNYQDIVISVSFNSGSGVLPYSIASFTITNDKGIKYVFSSPDTVTQKTTGGSHTYFSRMYSLYQNGIRYFDNWHLTSITDANGNGVVLSYTPGVPRSSTDPISLYIGGSSTAALQYNIEQTVFSHVMNNIESTDNYSSMEYLNFTWMSNAHVSGSYYIGTSQNLIGSITGCGRNFQFNYSDVYFVTSYPTSYNRYFLRNFSDVGCGTPVSYTFSYAGETFEGSIGGLSLYSTTLPDSSTNKYDYWGYFSTYPSSGNPQPSVYVNPSNGSYQRYEIDASSSVGSSYSYTLSHTSRIADPSNITIGSLTSITYPNGGSTTLAYEPNDYLDAAAGATVQGGGIRVTSITDYDSVSTGNNIVRNYSYLDPSSVTSGRALSLPQYAFTMPYGGSATGSTLWTDATVLSATDLSDEDHTIIYGYVTESQTGAGKTVYHFSTPATNWDASATPVCSGCSTAEWYPTINYEGRTNCSLTYGPVNNGIDNYPFSPKPNYDFERGLPLSVISYNNSGTEVAESDYTYTRYSSPGTISGLRFADNVNGSLTTKAYSKYTIFYNTGELSSQVVKKVYGSGSSPGSPQTSTANYTYGSSYHHLMTQEQVTNSDNSVLTTNIKYTKDYAPSGSTTNANITALYNLQSLNENIPIETWQQIYNGSTTKTTSASLTLFQATTSGSVTNYVPSQSLKFMQPDGVTDFTAFSINNSTPSITYDSRYFTVANYSDYDKTGHAQTIDDGHQHKRVLLTSYFNTPMAVFDNTSYPEIAFYDFEDNTETNPGYWFTLTGGTFTYATSSHAGTAVVMTSSMTLSHTANKNSSAQNYIFSIWIKNEGTSSGSINASINGGTATSLISYAASSGWKYYQASIPLSGLSGSTISVSFSPTTTIDIDDILLYPDVATAMTVTYDPTSHYKIAETNTNGVSAYYTNDQWGRLLYAYDQDHQILQRNTYVTSAETNFSPTITVGAGYSGSPSTFYIYGIDDCVGTGTTVDWSYGPTGAGSTGVSISSPPSYTYTSPGTYTVTAVVHSPLFGNKTITTSVTITAPVTYIPVTYNTYTFGNGDISSITFTSTGYTHTYSNSDLITGFSIPQGNYTVSISLSDGAYYNSGTGLGYRSVGLTGANGANYTSSNTYSIAINLSTCTTLNVVVSQYGWGD